MKQTLKENGGLPPLILWTLSIVAGISVANLYYNQPLLNMIRHDLDVSEFDQPDRYGYTDWLCFRIVIRCCHWPICINVKR